MGGQVNTQNLALTPTTLTGVVTDTVTGLPIPNATIIFTDSQGMVFTATTSVSGAYAFTSTLTRPIAAGVGTLTSGATSYVPAAGYSPSVTINPGANVKDAPLTPTRMTGVVRDAATTGPIPGAAVTVTDSAGHVYATTADANGVYTFTGTITQPLAPGSATVVGTADGYLPDTHSPILVAGELNIQDLSLTRRQPRLTATKLDALFADADNNGLPTPGTRWPIPS